MSYANPGPAISSNTNQATGVTASWSDSTGASLVKPNGSLSKISSSLSARMKAAASAALGYNSVLNNPWLPPVALPGGGAQAWSAGATVKPGAIFTNVAGTHMFFARQSTGVTGGAEPGALTTPVVTSAGLNMADITDNQVVWNWIGPVRTTAALSGAPTITMAAKAAYLTKQWDFAPQTNGAALSSNFRGAGCVSFTAGLSTNFQVFPRGSFVGSGGDTQITAGGTYARSLWAAAIEFMSDANLISFNLDNQGAGGSNAGNGFYIEIDGRRVMDGALVVNVNGGAGTSFINFDFRSATGGGRRARRYRISTLAQSYANFFTSPVDSVWFPENQNRYTIAVVGDSLTSGLGASAQGPGIPQFDWTSLFGSLIGCDSVVNLGQSGTGFLTNTGGPTYGQRIADVIACNPDVVYIAGAVNDSSFSSSARQAAMLSYLQAIRAALPNAMIVFAGTWGGTNITNSIAIESDQINVLNAFNDSNTYFIPVSTDNPTWTFGTGTLAAPNNSGNTDIYLGQTGDLHPSLMGTIYHASKHANAFRKIINTLP